jgi:Fe2+ transport system protein FeoA
MLQGEFGYIVDLNDLNVTTQLFEAGCFPGDLIRIVENQPAREFITFRYRRNLIHLDRAKAHTIMTNPISYSFCLN